MTRYNVASQFTTDLGGRYRDDGDHSGEEFREDVLVGLVQEALKTNEPVVVNFDDVTGLPTSFLEEAFGGLLRRHTELPAQRVLSLVRIEAAHSPKLWPYIRFAEEVMQAQARTR